MTKLSPSGRSSVIPQANSKLSCMMAKYRNFETTRCCVVSERGGKLLTKCFPIEDVLLQRELDATDTNTQWMRRPLQLTRTNHGHLTAEWQRATWLSVPSWFLVDKYTEPFLEKIWLRGSTWRWIRATKLYSTSTASTLPQCVQSRLLKHFHAFGEHKKQISINVCSVYFIESFLFHYFSVMLLLKFWGVNLGVDDYGQRNILFESHRRSGYGDAWMRWWRSISTHI